MTIFPSVCRVARQNRSQPLPFCSQKEDLALLTLLPFVWSPPNDSPPQNRPQPGRPCRGRCPGSQHRRNLARRYQQARRCGGAGDVDQVRWLGPQRLPADGCRNPCLPGGVVVARSRRYPLCPGAGAQFRPTSAGGFARYRGRDFAGGDPGPQEHPGEFGGLLRAGRQVSAAGVGAYVGGDGRCCRGAPDRDLRAAIPRQAGAGDCGGPASGGRTGDLLLGRHPGGRRDGVGHREHHACRHAGRPWQCLCRRGQAAALWPGWHRSVRGPDRNPGDRR